jgi:mRNA-degrading endonuclease RelE of RelBE toxin-antitoxin system
MESCDGASCPLNAYELGKLVKASLSEKFGNGAFDGLIEDVLDVVETGEEVRFAINNNLRLLTSQNKERSMKHYDDPVGIEELKLGLIGRVFLALGSEKLTGRSNLYRVRQGSHRVIYSVDDKALVVDVVKVGHRRDVYR